MKPIESDEAKAFSKESAFKQQLLQESHEHERTAGADKLKVQQEVAKKAPGNKMAPRPEVKR